MGKKGEDYKRRKRARREAEFEEIAGKIRTILFSPKLRDAAEWIDAHPGKDPEYEQDVYKILDALKRLQRNWEAAERRYQKRREQLKVVK